MLREDFVSESITYRLSLLPAHAFVFLADVFAAFERESLSFTEYTEEQLLERGLEIIESLAQQSSFGAQIVRRIRGSESRYYPYIDIAPFSQLDEKFPIGDTFAA